MKSAVKFKQKEKKERTTMKMRKKIKKLFAAILMAGTIAAGNTAADERLFTYTYEPKVLPKGKLEFESWSTLRTGKEKGKYYRWDIREEIEYGLGDRTTTALYFNFRSIEVDGNEELEGKEGFEFKGISSEWKYKLADPTASPLGALVYGEVTYSGEELELEGKLVLGKNIGKWALAYNLVLEHEWEFESKGTETKVIWENDFGASYRFTPSFAAGFELRTHSDYPDWDYEHTAIFFGPALHYRSEGWWATLTIMPQVYGTPETENKLHLDEHEKVEARLIVGIDL